MSLRADAIPLLLGLSDAAAPDQMRRMVAGRLVVVTGASRGIGAEISVRLAAVGAHVIGVARTEDDLARLKHRLASAAGEFDYLTGDLRQTDWAEAAGRTIIDRWGPPELVIANAGHSIRRYLDDYTDRFHDITRTAGINYLGQVAFLLPLLQAMSTGHLVGIASTSVDLPVPGWSAYTASKTAFETWLTCVAPELGARGIAVTSVHLPRVKTAMSAPTAGRYRVPELTTAQAADVLCGAIVHRPRLVVPWWARWSAVVAAAAPVSVDRLWTWALRSGLRP
jgi:short-subunit dehydrogenase